MDEVVTTLLLIYFLLLVSLLLEGPLRSDGMGWKSARLLANPSPKLLMGYDCIGLDCFNRGFHHMVVNTKTTFGYAMRAVGYNAEAARYAGMPVIDMIQTALLSGGLAA